jgi:hypothetical protein
VQPRHLVALLASLALVLVSQPANSAPAPTDTTITLKAPRYTVTIGGAADDDYHCSLINPKFKKSGFLTSVRFSADNAAASHHAILYRIPSSQAAEARAKDVGGKGWTCFGGPGIGSALDGGAWLSAWAPGAGIDSLPKGTGVPVSAGDLIVLQMHYNLLRVGESNRDDQSTIKLKFTTKKLIPLTNALFPAPVNLPCPEDVTGPLCDRRASLKDLADRVGAQVSLTAQALEFICGRGLTGPKVGNETDCSRTVPEGGVVRRVSAHMHMLGRSMTLTVNPGTPTEKVIFEEPNYNFDYQRAVALKSPHRLKAGDVVKVTCTFDPKLRTMLPELKKLTPRYITWGEGSSDEMCLAVVQISPR